MYAEVYFKYVDTKNQPHDGRDDGTTWEREKGNERTTQDTSAGVARATKERIEWQHGWNDEG